MKKILLYSSIYFGIVFSFGFVLGTVRVLLLAPHLGEEKAELLEAPLMILVCYLSSRYIIGKAGNSLDTVQAAIVGLLALLYLLVVELTGVLTLRELSIAEFLESKYSVAGLVYAVSLILYALFPYLVSSSKGRN